MFDGIKILNALGDIEALNENTCLDWINHSRNSTGELEGRTAHYNNLLFSIKGKNLRILGSLHKYFNNGEHNANDFNTLQVAETIHDLQRRFRISPNSLLNNLEFGVNVRTTFAPKKFLKRLICYKGVPFEKTIDNGTNFYQCKHDKFILKIYDKGTQYSLNSHLLRFEIKVLGMQFFASKDITIKTLHDLTNTANYEHLGSLLLEYFNQILLDEPTITPEGLSEAQKHLLDIGRNPKTWVRPQRDDFPNKTEYDRVRKEQERREKKFVQLLQDHPKAERWQQKTSALIAQKWEELTLKSCRKCLDFQDTNTPTQKGENVANVNYTLIRHLRQSGEPQNTPSKRTCKVTGTDISQQQNNALFLTETTLRKDSDLLTTLRPQHQQKKRKRQNHDEAYYIAHNIRNKHHNAANNLRNKIRKIQTANALFDQSGTIRLTEEEKQLLERWKGTPYEIKLERRGDEETQ